MALRCQVRILAQRRGYDADEEAGLLELFGSRGRWPTTLKPFIWMHSGILVQGFADSTDVDLPLPCTFDFDVAAAKYLNSLRDGTVPLEFLFSGTVFTQGRRRASASSRFPGTGKRPTALPVAAWRPLMDAFFPNQGWIRLDRDVLAALARYKSVRGLTSWEAAVEWLLAGGLRVTGAAAVNTGLSLARAVADAVLYEGYLLYPYRASSAKNQARWQFGMLGPPGAAEAGAGEEPDMFADCLLEPGTRGPGRRPPALPAPPDPYRRTQRTTRRFHARRRTHRRRRPAG